MSHSRTERLADSIARSNVLGPDETPGFEVLRAEYADPDGLAREMVRRRWLTTYQADRLLDGKVDEVVLGPYLLLELLGEGGMGRVYKARHRLMNRVVALKVIRSDLLGHGEARPRFLREIEAAARVWHPNLVTALDAAPIGDSFVLVMEYVEGITLSQWMKDRGVPPIRTACDWARQAALGLHHAHERGLIHRDVKPSNLLLTEGEKLVKVLDLGLARLELTDAVPEGEEPLTASGVVIGTPDYMSPEQAIAPSTADARSDVYSLGCTLYHLLTGRPPFPGGSLTQKLLWHQQSEPADPSRLRPSLPPGLPQVLARMTAKTPGDRYSTAAEVAEALAHYCSAARLMTLPAAESPQVAPESPLTPRPTHPTPMVRHEPRDAVGYEVLDEAGSRPEPGFEAPEPPTVTGLGAESWWKEPPAPAVLEKAATASPSHPPRPASRPDARLIAGLGVVCVALALLVLWAVGAIGG
ncbi:MAG: protein kinase [Isosphaeraceae bacterium]